MRPASSKLGIARIHNDSRNCLSFNRYVSRKIVAVIMDGAYLFDIAHLALTVMLIGTALLDTKCFIYQLEAASRLTKRRVASEGFPLSEW